MNLPPSTMCDRVNLKEIRKIPQEEFKEILHSWMDQKEIAQTLQKKLRKQLVTDFQKTELARRLTTENNKNLFDSKEYVIDTLQAEHLYSQNNHFTLSVFFTETRHPTLLPDFEKDERFKFEKSDIQALVELLGKRSFCDCHGKIVFMFFIPPIIRTCQE